MSFIFWLIFAILFIVFIILRDKAQKEKHHELQELYLEMRDKWKKKRMENFTEAMKIYPSKQFFEINEEKWRERVDKQREYSQKLDDLYAKQLQKEYNLTRAEWEKLESAFAAELLNKVNK